MDERLKKRQCCSHFIMTQLRFWRDAFRHSFHEMLEYFLALPDDDILYGFRRRAVKETPGRELGGWYSNDSSEYSYIGFDEIFNTFGQWLSFLGRGLSSTDRKSEGKRKGSESSEWMGRDDR